MADSNTATWNNEARWLKLISEKKTHYTSDDLVLFTIWFWPFTLNIPLKTNKEKVVVCVCVWGGGLFKCTLIDISPYLRSSQGRA